MAEKHRAAVLATLRHMVAEAGRGTEGLMFGYPSFFINGKMFACIYGEGVGFRVPVSLAQALSKRGDVAAFRPHGRPPMREWVQVNHPDPSDYQADPEVFFAAMNYVGRLATARGTRT